MSADMCGMGNCPISSASSIGAGPHYSPRNQTEAAGAPNRLTVTCYDCDGSGEEWFIALDGREYELGHCTTCDGTGLVEATCDCGEPLDENGWCASCEAFDNEPQCAQCGCPLEEVPCDDCEKNLVAFERLRKGGIAL